MGMEMSDVSALPLRSVGDAPVPVQMGLSLDGVAGAAGGLAPGGPLAARFVVPPFTVLDARQGYWQERKRAWLGLGIRSELGRGAIHLGLSAEVEAYRRGEGEYAKDGPAKSYGSGGPATPSAARPAWRGQGKTNLLVPGGAGTNSAWAASGSAARKYGQQSLNAAVGHDTGANANESGTSVFDPVLCELMYRWFCPPGGAVLDPFAGGSVRGVVASWLGYAYTGIDLRPQQVAANQQQGATILSAGHRQPAWLTGDSRGLPALVPQGAAYDFVFTCPPYHDLERYSDDPRDLSNAGGYAAFLDGLGQCLRAAMGLLRADRLGAVVVGNVRDGRGALRDLCGDTTRLMAEAGYGLFNDAVLVTMAGSLPVRVSGQFDGGRKLGRSHQTILVYAKGDPRAAARACGGGA